MDQNTINTVALAVLYVLVLGVWKPWSAAYAREKGKNLARKEDLAEILAELRAVTITQKEIETQLSGDLWNQQTHWNQKRELYGKLLSTLNRLIETSSDLSSTREFQSTIDPSDEQAIATVQEHMHGSLVSYRTTHTEFLEAIGMAQIFASADCNAGLERLLTLNSLQATTQEWAKEEVRRYLAARSFLIAAAKADLGLT